MTPLWVPWHPVQSLVEQTRRGSTWVEKPKPPSRGTSGCKSSWQWGRAGSAGPALHPIGRLRGSRLCPEHPKVPKESLRQHGFNYIIEKNTKGSQRHKTKFPPRALARGELGAPGETRDGQPPKSVSQHRGMRGPGTWEGTEGTI